MLLYVFSTDNIDDLNCRWLLAKEKIGYEFIIFCAKDFCKLRGGARRELFLPGTDGDNINPQPSSCLNCLRKARKVSN